jgi:hypothetical protein
MWKVCGFGVALAGTQIRSMIEPASASHERESILEGRCSYFFPEMEDSELRRLDTC